MDIEFLRPDGTPEPVPEELLHGGPPRRPRRRLIVTLVVVGVVLVGAGVLASVLRGGSGTHPAARGASGGQASSFSATSGASVVPISIQIPAGSPAVELNDLMITEVGGALFWTSLDGTYSANTDLGDAAADYLLVADPAARRVWTLLTGAANEIVWRASSGPAEGFSFAAPGRLAGGAVLDGKMYVTTDTGVFRVDSDQFKFTVASTPVRGGLEMAADPARHRLLLVDSGGAQATLRAQRPGDGHPEATGTLPFGKGTVVVADGAIWAAGYGSAGAVLARLDPTTLRVVATSPAAAELGPGAEVVGVGRRVLFVRSGGGSNGLWCVDARTGAVDEAWPSVTGAVGLGLEGGYELSSTGQAPRLLTGGRCPG